MQSPTVPLLHHVNTLPQLNLNAPPNHPNLAYSKSFSHVDHALYSDSPQGRQGASHYHQQAPPVVQQYHRQHHQIQQTPPQHKSAPASPVRQPHGAPRVSTPSPNPGR